MGGVGTRLRRKSRSAQTVNQNWRIEKKLAYYSVKLTTFIKDNLKSHETGQYLVNADKTEARPPEGLRRPGQDFNRVKVSKKGIGWVDAGLRPFSLTNKTARFQFPLDPLHGVVLQGTQKKPNKCLFHKLKRNLETRIPTTAG